MVVVVDDLGMGDLGAFNGNKTKTPNIDKLIADGITLSHYNAFKICSPTRISLMTSRYPWKVGYYSMADDDNKNTTDFVFLPQYFQDAGYRTTGIGKYDVGWLFSAATPTFRGFDDSFMYYEAALGDYWYHTMGTAGRCMHEGHTSWKVGPPYDLSNSTKADGIFPADPATNGTYDMDLFTARGVAAVESAAKSDTPFFIYFAPMNVHEAGGIGADGKNTVLGVQAPCSTINEFSTTVNDTYKAQAGMLAELDKGVGDVVRSMKQTGLWDNTVLVVTSDNGGPLPHSTNAGKYVRRGGKHTFYIGGTGVVGIVSGGLVPPSRRGTEWKGLAHVSDLGPTLVEGVAGLTIPADTGPQSMDGHNLWPAILANSSSPRTSVIHQVSNQYFSENVTAITAMGDNGEIWKLINGDPGDPRIVFWPEAGEAVPFGESGGKREKGTDHCRAPKLDVPKWKKVCIDRPCLFDLAVDESESHDVGGDPNNAAVVSKLMAALDAAGKSAPPVNTFFNASGFRTAYQAACTTMNVTRVMEPFDWKPSSSSSSSSPNLVSKQ